MTIKIASAVTTATVVALALAPVAGARPSDPGVVNYAVLARGSVSNVLGGAARVA